LTGLLVHFGLAAPWCKACLRTLNDKSGTDFEYSRIPLYEGLFIMYLSGCLNVPLLRASIDVGRSYGSVYRSFRRIMYSVGRYVRRYGGSWEIFHNFSIVGLQRSRLFIFTRLKIFPLRCEIEVLRK
jgi:hypothetical protein